MEKYIISEAFERMSQNLFNLQIFNEDVSYLPKSYPHWGEAVPYKEGTFDNRQAVLDYLEVWKELLDDLSKINSSSIDTVSKFKIYSQKFSDSHKSLNKDALKLILDVLENMIYFIEKRQITDKVKEELTDYLSDLISFVTDNFLNDLNDQNSFSGEIDVTSLSRKEKSQLVNNIVQEIIRRGIPKSMIPENFKFVTYKKGKAIYWVTQDNFTQKDLDKFNDIIYSHRFTDLFLALDLNKILITSSKISKGWQQDNQDDNFVIVSPYFPGDYEFWPTLANQMGVTAINRYDTTPNYNKYGYEGNSSTEEEPVIINSSDGPFTLYPNSDYLVIKDLFYLTMQEAKDSEFDEDIPMFKKLGWTKIKPGKIIIPKGTVLTFTYVSNPGGSGYFNFIINHNQNHIMNWPDDDPQYNLDLINSIEEIPQQIEDTDGFDYTDDDFGDFQ